MIARCLVVLAIAAAPAAAETRTRVVLADQDAELHRALSGALAPWHVDLVIDATPIVDDDDAIHRAASWNARFVVWRDGDRLVVFDRERALSDHRAARAGALAPPDAAAAALTVKTMLRLPPSDAAPDPAPGVVAPVASGPELRLEIGGGGRVAFADRADLGARQFDRVMVRPTRALGLRVGLGAELGSEIAIARGGFVGGWSDWELDAIASWTVALGRWELEPFAGFGIAHARLDGMEANVARVDTEVALAGIAGGALRRKLGTNLAIAATFAVRGVTSTSAYTSTQGQGQATGKTPVFQAPGIATSLGLSVSVDFGL